MTDQHRIQEDNLDENNLEKIKIRILKFNTDEEVLKKKQRQLKFGVNQSELASLSQLQYKMAYRNQVLIKGIKNIEDELTPEEIQKRAERAQKWNIVKYSNVKPQENRNFYEKKQMEFDEDIIIREDTLYMHGVDYMSQQDILDYFKSYKPQKIEWINDSSCNVVFENTEYVKKALVNLSLYQQTYDDVWREGFSYQADGIFMKIFMRFATNKDIKEQSTQGKDSKFYKYQFMKSKHHKNKFNQKNDKDLMRVSKKFITKEQK